MLGPNPGSLVMALLLKESLGRAEATDHERKSEWRPNPRGLLVRGFRKRLEDVFASDDAGELLVAVHHRNATETMLDHQLQHARQPRFGAHIDEVGRHHVGDG